MEEPLRVTTEELRAMYKTLTADEIDDGEEILMWFAEYGPSIILELLDVRRTTC